MSYPTRLTDEQLAALKAMEYSEAPPSPFLRELIFEAEESRKLLMAAMHALRSYQYGTCAPDLARSIAGDIEKLLDKR